MTDGQWISDCLGMSVEQLPVRYLGLPLFSSRMSKGLCAPLIDRVKGRLASWQKAFLSMAGRVELVRSVLTSYSIYWSSAFLLPRSVLKEIESLFIRFLWGDKERRPWVAVSWADICVPREEGGLSLRRLVDWNDAGMVRLFWLVASEDSSLWVRWIRRKYLHARNIWNARPPNKCSWAWRGILRVRHVVIANMRISNVGGRELLLWSPTNSPRLTARQAWEVVRARRPPVEWANLVWHRDRVPRHARVVWRAIRGRLCTHDQLQRRGWMLASSCVLCGCASEDHTHLFIHCPYSRSLWERIFSTLRIVPQVDSDVLTFVGRID